MNSEKFQNKIEKKQSKIEQNREQTFADQGTNRSRKSWKSWKFT